VSGVTLLSSSSASFVSFGCSSSRVSKEELDDGDELLICGTGAEDCEEGGASSDDGGAVGEGEGDKEEEEFDDESSLCRFVIVDGRTADKWVKYSSCWRVLARVRKKQRAFASASASCFHLSSTPPRRTEN